MDDDLYDQHRVDVESAEPKSPLGYCVSHHRYLIAAHLVPASNRPLSDEQFANVETNAPRPPSPALAHREPSVPAPASKPSSLVNPLPPASTASVASTGVLNAKVPHASNPSEQQPTFVKLTVAAPRRPPASRLKYTVLPDHRTTTTPGTEHAATVPASTVLAPAVRLPAVGYSTSQQSPAKISKVVPTASSAVKHTPAPARLSPTQSSYPSAAFDTFISLSTEELEKRVFHKMTDVMGFRVCKWRSEGQRLSVRRALAHQESFVTVLPTGSGKTMIPLSCAALDPDSLNMYIAPLNSVLAMASEAAHSPLLHSQLYETGVPIRSDTRLLIASADKASYSDFFRVISTALDAYPYLRVRYFVDEGHIPVTDDEFRRRLRVMRELLAPGPAQMIVMSATIPPAMETRLMDTYGLDPAHTSVIRTTTHRNEIMYDVKAEQKSVENAVDAAFQDFSQHSSAGDRAIIFVRDARDGRRACARLKQLTGREPSFYYGGSAAKSLGVPKQSDQEHRTIADDWENGLTGNFIVATSAYGSGVNCPNVAHVYHIRVPTTVLNYVQESGRAGRMGQLSRAVVFLVSSNDGYTKSKKDGSTFFGLPPVPETDIAGVGVVRELFTSGTRYCIRAQLAQFVDGTPTKCSDFTVPCGPCARRGLMARNPMPPHEHAIIGSTSSSPPSLLGKRAHGDIDPFEDAHMRAREARANRLYLESLAANALRPALDFFADKCGFCAAMGQEDVERHATRTCSSMKAAVDPYPHPVLPDTPSHFPGKPTNYLDVYFQRFQIRYQVDPVYPVCYKCHLPQVQGIEHDEEFVAGFDEPCAEEDLFLSVAFGVAANEGLWTLAQTRFVAGGWSDINAYMSWLADGHTDENKLSLTNIQRIFVWCADHLESVLRSQAQARAAAHGRRPGFAL
ncbi:hypothetical protein PENSPDRAFT_148266 [Peniophora sp. CONT]|nr:hypothetical protein PENSPDRAFT_148266 [Peniophora sp. CONT]